MDKRYGGRYPHLVASDRDHGLQVPRPADEPIGGELLLRGALSESEYRPCQKQVDGTTVLKVTRSQYQDTKTLQLPWE